jgi:hypothetical protein
MGLPSLFPIPGYCLFSTIPLLLNSKPQTVFNDDILLE